IVRKFVDIDTTIGQNSLVSIDVADAGSGCYYSLQPSLGGMGGRQAGHWTLELLNQSCCRTGRKKTTRAAATNFYTPKSLSFQLRYGAGSSAVSLAQAVTLTI